MSTVLLHGVEDSLCLEASSFQCGTCNVSSLCVLGDTENGALCIIDPVWCEETGKGGNEDKTTVVVDSRGEF